MPRSADQPIRIRFEHTRYLHWGGHAGYVQFVRHLDPRRYRSVTHAASDSDDDLSGWLNPVRPLLKQVIRRGKMPWYKLSDLNAELGAFVDCLGGRQDIVHFLDGEHSGQFLPRILRWAALSGIRTVATFHQPPNVLRDVLNPAILRRFDQIVLVSPSQRSYFSRHVAEDRLHVILHGVDAEFFHPAPRRNSPAAIRCITVGHWLRDWEVFRAVVCRMPSITFEVVTSRDMGLGGLPNVRQHRNVSDAALADLYRSADILFLPLTESTASNALLEGIASGLPVVVTDLEAVRAYLAGGEGMLVDGNRPEAFVKALGRLRDDGVLRAGMGRCARARAEALGWPRLVGQYEALYEAALARPHQLAGIRAIE